MDYGVGNIASVLNMFRRVGAPAVAAATPHEVRNASRILLPGVGSFDHGMQSLGESRLLEPLLDRVGAGVPVLGICLGMQMLTRASAEGETPGLGLVAAECKRLTAAFGAAVKVPHMGWNHVAARRAHPLLEGLAAENRFYFVHSYYVVCDDPASVLGITPYGTDFVSMFQVDNLMGAQFHPEKSHRFGMRLLSNFAAMEG